MMMDEEIVKMVGKGNMEEDAGKNGSYGEEKESKTQNRISLGKITELAKNLVNDWTRGPIL